MVMSKSRFMPPCRSFLKRALDATVSMSSKSCEISEVRSIVFPSLSTCTCYNSNHVAIRLTKSTPSPLG